MTEIPKTNIVNDLTPDFLPQAEPDRLVNFELPKEHEAAEDLRAAQEAWLERRGMQDTPRIAMTRREFELLREVGLGDGSVTASPLIDKARKSYDISPEAKYAWVDVAASDANPTPVSGLVAIGEEDFGTVIDTGRLEDQGIEPEDMPHVAMTRREFELFRLVSLESDTTPSLIRHTRDLCGIPHDDQYAPRYALVDIEPDDPSLPSEPALVDVSEEDFGTVVDAEAIAKDFGNTSPGSTPEVVTVDISEALIDSHYDLQDLATAAMKGITSSPFFDGNNDIGIRAGGLFAGQKDAYVWTKSPLSSSIELTIALPSVYDSVCIVSGQQRDANNGKAGMAQIDNPREIMKIEGEALKQMQDIYRRLYNQPDFALTEIQRTERDILFNDRLRSLMAEAVMKNQAQQQGSSSSYTQAPKVRYHPHP